LRRRHDSFSLCGGGSAIRRQRATHRALSLDNGFETTIAYHQEQPELPAIFVATLLPVAPEGSGETD
jgi:hypothetical protein